MPLVPTKMADAQYSISGNHWPGGPRDPKRSLTQDMYLQRIELNMYLQRIELNKICIYSELS